MPQNSDEARRRLHEDEQTACEAEQERAKKRPRGQRAFNTADPEVRPWYNRWAGGLLEWESLVAAVGRDMAEFIRAAASVDPAEVETQSFDVQEAMCHEAQVPATVPYESDDDAETQIMGIFPDAELEDRSKEM